MIRTFIAIEIPDEIKGKIARFQKQVAADEKSIRWVNVKNIHITLKFIGEIPESLVEKIVISIFEKPPQINTFEIGLKGTGAFPNLRRPRVVWVGITSGNEQLTKLVTYLEAQLTILGIPKENRKFKSHVTIGRIKNNQKLKNPEIFDNPDALDAGEFQAQKIVLMKSELKPSGAEYSVLAEQSLNNKDSKLITI